MLPFVYLCCFLQDYKGQKLAEQIFQGIILVSAVSKFHNLAWFESLLSAIS